MKALIKGQVIFTELQGDNVKLTVRKNDCSYKQEGETEVIVHKYDSTLVTGACVKVSDNGQGVKTFLLGLQETQSNSFLEG